MPNFFRLTRKSAPEAGPVVLNTVDEEIAALVGEPVDNRRYCCGWFDLIGGRLAGGMSWGEIRAAHLSLKTQYPDDADLAAFQDMLVKITDWLEANFDVESGYTRRRD
jgi:hypothetical protein